MLPLISFCLNGLICRGLLQIGPAPQRAPKENLWELLKHNFYRPDALRHLTNSVKSIKARHIAIQ